MTTADYYRTHGDSEHVLLVEQALDQRWRSIREIAERSGKSEKFTREVLRYLFEEGRAERGQEDIAKPYMGQRWKWVWRRPS